MSFLTSREQVAPQGIGKPVRRREDARLLTGGGRFADETNLPGQSYACMVRSPHAHALIASIDTGPAEGMPGVIGVLTGSDLLLALAYIGFFLNLFNLLPVVPLDGGRAMAAPRGRDPRSAR